MRFSGESTLYSGDSEVRPTFFKLPEYVTKLQIEGCTVAFLVLMGSHKISTCYSVSELSYVSKGQAGYNKHQNGL